MMEESEQRHIARDSLFVLADMRLQGGQELHRIKVRNLSAGGMMGEGAVRVSRGSTVSVDIRNIGWVEGTVAWVQESRFGVAFCQEIDPKFARVTIGRGDQTPSHISNALRSQAQGGMLRKI